MRPILLLPFHTVVEPASESKSWTKTRCLPVDTASDTLDSAPATQVQYADWSLRSKSSRDCFQQRWEALAEALRCGPGKGFTIMRITSSLRGPGSNAIELDSKLAANITSRALLTAVRSERLVMPAGLGALSPAPLGRAEFLPLTLCASG